MDLEQKRGRGRPRRIGPPPTITHCVRLSPELTAWLMTQCGNTTADKIRGIIEIAKECSP